MIKMLWRLINFCQAGLIKTEQLRRVIERTDLASAETLIIHVGTNDLRSARNLDFIMRDVYELVSTTKKKLPNCRLVLSGVLRRRDVSWRHIGGLTIDSTG